MMAIGILGGTFDPVHNAHLAMARAALEALALERVLFLPTGAPRYRAPALASGAHRVAMLRLAIAGEPRFTVDERELAPGHSGYTIDTLAGFTQRPVLLLGADQYAKFETWHRWREILERADLAVFARPGSEFRDGRARQVPFVPMDVSASGIRARLARGESIAGLVPPAVADYIARHRLYGHP
ncbi:MAG: nicotinate (nicotinamide) nucleotide adenylyltransferase [Betaproteobacteria bacterium]|nr:nicotinate (nicotinamide) nucleotide adenylyltransferase [Betaproteobacteria bacterium]